MSSRIPTLSDLVRAVWIDGKPRHKFALGLGSLKDERPSRGKHSLPVFWIKAVTRMKRYGFDEAERRRIADGCDAILSGRSFQNRFENPFQ